MTNEIIIPRDAYRAGVSLEEAAAAIGGLQMSNTQCVHNWTLDGVCKKCGEHGISDSEIEAAALDADCAACISVGLDFSETCNGKPCPHWEGHHV